MKASGNRQTEALLPIEDRIEQLLGTLSLVEKIGQMCQVCASMESAPDHLGEGLRQGRIGAVLNITDVDAVNELQRIAVEESRAGIPLLIGRDVIHGFRTIMPIPLGQAASWNPDLVRRASRAAALEAARSGINWTFAPVIDISRDPRWGRIAESFGEDTYLTCRLGRAMIEGFQQEDLALAGSIAACAKHFAGYGAAESGRDYATTNIPENELRNVYLPPFEAAVQAGAASVMTSFCDLDGIPATASEFLNRKVLREEWQFDGFVVSDWDSIRQLAVHGLTSNDADSALEAATAGVNMEMAGDVYVNHLEQLVQDGRLGMDVIDDAVRNILRVKFRLGLFENPYTNPADYPSVGGRSAMDISRELAVQSTVLLQNRRNVLPLSSDRLTSLAVIGPLADAPHEQLGTWVFDGDSDLSVTPLRAITDRSGEHLKVRYARGLKTSRSRDNTGFDEAIAAASESDAVILFLGEESILSGEAHSRADINLPGAQVELVRRIRETNRPVIAVILAGRPLTLSNIVEHVDAILYSWHPGTMGGPAIADLLFGITSPSGKLPVSFPAMVGQIPLYYNRKMTGRPPVAGDLMLIDDIPECAPQTSFGMSAYHLDAGHEPLFPFGHGLSYAKFEYEDIRLSSSRIRAGESLTVSANLSNRGDVPGVEIAQLYVRDLVGNVTRPIRELKGFKHVKVEPGQTVRVDFELQSNTLGFFDRNNRRIVEPGEFHVWIGGSSAATLQGGFWLVDGDDEHSGS